MPAGSTGMRGLVRETFLYARMASLPRTPRTAAGFPCGNNGFAAHKFLQAWIGDVFDIKETFSL